MSFKGKLAQTLRSSFFTVPMVIGASLSGGYYSASILSGIEVSDTVISSRNNDTAIDMFNLQIDSMKNGLTELSSIQKEFSTASFSAELSKDDLTKYKQKIDDASQELDRKSNILFSNMLLSKQISEKDAKNILYTYNNEIQWKNDNFKDLDAERLGFKDECSIDEPRLDLANLLNQSKKVNRCMARKEMKNDLGGFAVFGLGVLLSFAASASVGSSLESSRRLEKWADKEARQKAMPKRFAN